MTEARWHDAVIARGDNTVAVDGAHYFPSDDVSMPLLRPSSTTTSCPWKGTAHYYSLLVDDAENADAAWHYSDPKPKAESIYGRIAVWRGVKVD